MSPLLTLLILAQSAAALDWPGDCHVETRPHKERLVCHNKPNPWQYEVRLYAVVDGQAVSYTTDLRKPWDQYVDWGDKRFGPFPNGTVHPGKTWVGTNEDAAIPYFYVTGTPGKSWVIADGAQSGPYESIGNVEIVGTTALISAKHDGAWFVQYQGVENGPFVFVRPRMDLWDGTHIIWYAKNAEGWFVYLNNDHNPFPYDGIYGLEFELDHTGAHAIIEVLYNNERYDIDLHKSPIEWVPTMHL